MNILTKLYSWYGKRTVLITATVIVVLAIAGVIFTFLQKSMPENTEPILPIVKVATISNIISNDSISLVGTVRAVSEADIESEVSGRITSVSVSLGETVQAGKIIAQQENASQRAAVLQAEGVYEAALAAAQQSGVSVEEARNMLTTAQNNFISSYTSAYTTANSVLLTTIDDFFANPESNIPGLRIAGRGYTQTLNKQRTSFVSLMNEWKQRTATLSSTSNLSEASVYAEGNIKQLITMIDIFIILVNDQDSETTVSGVAVESYNSTLLTDRATLNTALSALQTNKTALVAAQENLSKAQIGGGAQLSSAANAQVKQALGALRAAQANLNKTIFRSPISGTVNSLNVSAGDYIGAFTKIAKIANNNGLEISTFVGESDLTRVTVGDEVLIENKFVGVVTHIAPGVDSVTQKSEVKIATETSKLTNGETVSVILQGVSSEKETMLLIPITAVKFSAEDGAVFSVTNNALVAHEVLIGNVRGSYVEILSGLDSAMEIVLDVRGLSEGTQVETTQ